MPTFSCDQCGESFNSKTKLDQHQAAAHGPEDGMQEQVSGWVEGIRNLLTWKGGLTLIGIFLMIALPLGGVMFYSSLAPDTGNSQDPGQTEDTNPPVGRNLQGIPSQQPAGLTIQTSYDRELSRQEQLYLLWRAGPQAAQLQGSRDLRPTVLLQYRCQDNCTQLREQVESFATDFNQNARWVQTAPYNDMSTDIAVTFPAQTPRRYSEFGSEALRSHLCEGISLNTGNGQAAWSSLVPLTACQDYDFGGSGNVTPAQ